MHSIAAPCHLPIQLSSRKPRPFRFSRHSSRDRRMDISVESSSSTLRRAAEPARLSPIVLSGLTALVEGALTALLGFALFYLYLGGRIPEQASRYEVAILIALQIQL